jgi:hypothetical protein
LVLRARRTTLTRSCGSGGQSVDEEVDALLAAGVPLEARSSLGETPFLFGARLDSIPLLDRGEE